MKAKISCALLCALMLASCATSSGIVDTGNGSYLEQINASALRGGETGAMAIAVKDANDFCAKTSGHAIVDDQRTGSGTNTVANGYFAGVQFHPGAAAIRFHCQ